MDNSDLIQRIPLGIVLNKIVYDGNGVHVDYTIVKVNQAFEALTGLKEKSTSGKTWREVWPETHEPLYAWIGKDGENGLEIASEPLEHYCPVCNKWFRIQAIPEKKGYFSTIFTDITPLKEKELAWEKSAWQLALLLESNEALSGTFDIDEILSALCNKGLGIIKKGCTSIYLLQGNVLIMGATCPLRSRDRKEKGATAFLADHPHIAEAIKTAKPVLIPDTDKASLTPEEQQIVDAQQLKTIIYCPITGSQDTMGIFIIGKASLQDPFTDEEISMFQALCTKAALSIENANLFRSVQHELEEKTQAEKALKESEERLDLAMSVANDGIWDWDLKTDKVFFDQRYYTMAGYPVGAFPNTLEEFQKRVHPEDLSGVMQKADEYLNRKRDIFDTEFRFKSGTGEWIWIRGRGEVVERDKKGNPVRFVGTHSDISRRKEAEQQREKALKDLQASENHYKTVFNNTGTATIIVEEDTTITLANKRFEELTGYTADEIEGKMSWKTFIVPEDLEKMVHYHNQRRINGRNIPTSYEFRLIDKNKQIHDISLEVGLIPDTNQSVASCLDISVRKKSEQQIRKLSSAIEQSPASIMICDLNGVIEYVNPKYIETTGFTLEEAIGSHSNILNSGHTSDEVYKHLWKTIKSGKNWRGELQNKNKNGELIWESVIISPLRNDAGVITHIIELKEDITQQKRKDLLHQIQFNIAQAVVTSEKTVDLLKVVHHELNKVFESKNLVVAFYDDTTRTLRSILWQDERDQYDEWPVANTLSGQVVILGKALRLDKEEITRDFLTRGIKSLGAIPEYWLGVPLAIPGKMVGVMFTQTYQKNEIIDIYAEEVFTIVANQISLFLEKSQYEYELIMAKERAEESDRLKSAFLTNMSHEIRTPMNGILGFMDLMKDIDITSKEYEDYIDIINKSGQRLLDTVNDIIEMSKIESGETTIHMKEVRPAERLHYLLKFFLPQAAEKGLYLNLIESPDTHNLIISTDPQKLDSILSNLIKNAIKFTNNGGIEFGSYLKHNEIVFFVRDTGKGIPKEHKAMIFDRFVQGDLALTRGYEGSGLGLSIVKAYVDRLNGKIEIESKKGEGSTFLVTLPGGIIKISKDRPEDDINLNENPLEINSGIKILIAEDDEISYQYLQTILEKSGAVLLRTTTGEETIEVLRKNNDISLILMDIKMQGMDGLEATRRIRTFNQSIPIIAQTAYSLQGDRERMIEAGCTDYVSKPIDKDQLLKMIRNSARQNF